MPNTIDGGFQEEARPLIDLIDSLRNLGIEKDLPIPQIAVMGDQSSGKSSVLEAISGIPFPRGSGLVTRCATQIQMGKGGSWCATASILRSEGNGDDLHQTVGTPEALGGLIEKLTDELCGSATFSKDVIQIKLRSPESPDLTVIDLPGIVRTNTNGQDKSVVQDVDALLDSYLRPERTLILAVIPCNVDIATVDILERATKVDPNGTRTVGVLTKPDLIDKGGEAEVLEVLMNRRKPLKLGYYMVKNRSQAELNGKLTLDAARATEKSYFDSHEIFKAVPANMLGVESLSVKLTELLVGHIRRALPGLFSDLQVAMQQTSSLLMKLGDAPPSTTSEQQLAVSKIMQDFNSKLALSVQSGRIAIGLTKEAKAFAQNLQKTKPDFEGKQDVFQLEFKFEHEGKWKYCRFDEKCSEGALGALDKTALGRPLQVGREVDMTKMDSFITGKALVSIGDETFEGTIFEEERSIKKPGSTATMTTCVATVEWGENKHEVTWLSGMGLPQAKVTIASDAQTFRRRLITMIEQNRGRLLPGFLDFEVFKVLMVEYVNSWRQDTSGAMKAIQQLVQNELECTVRDIVPNRFPAMQQCMLLALGRAVQVAFNCEGKGLVASMRKAFDRERTPSTDNHYLMDTVNKVGVDISH
jgi:interferon-induced GTP-binding protein Mx1